MLGLMGLWPMQEIARIKGGTSPHPLTIQGGGATAPLPLLVAPLFSNQYSNIPSWGLLDVWYIGHKAHKDLRAHDRPSIRTEEYSVCMEGRLYVMSDIPCSSEPPTEYHQLTASFILRYGTQGRAGHKCINFQSMRLFSTLCPLCIQKQSNTV